MGLTTRGGTKLRLAPIDFDGSTPLHYAAAAGSVAEARWLLAAGADANASGIIGDIPLHSAARFNCSAAVTEALIAAGPDPNAQNEDGDTPVALSAARKDTGSATEALIAAGADSDARIKQKTPVSRQCGVTRMPVVGRRMFDDLRR